MIPISPDVRLLVGEWAEQVENRSLLHEKFALPKLWGAGEGAKLDNAGRWSVLRIVSRGSDLLRKDAEDLGGQARRLADKNPEKAERSHQQAEMALKMSLVAKGDAALVQVANRNSRSLLSDLARSFSGRVVTFEARLGGRLMVNLAGGVIENSGMALDRCFGLPFIPGSALKGISRSQALWEIHAAEDSEKERLLRMAMVLFGFGARDVADKGDFGWAGGSGLAGRIAASFGTTELKGCASFLPAYPTSTPVLVVEMVNPHHPDYHSGKAKMARDDENPRPNYFPAVESGASFGFALVIQRAPLLDGSSTAELLAQARQWMERAVSRKGVGAKTAAGYGWFDLPTGPSTDAPGQSGGVQGGSGISAAAAAETPADTCIRNWAGKLGTSANFAGAVPEMAALVDDTDLKKAFEAIIPEPDRRRLRKNHPYWQSFTSGRHGELGKRILVRLGLKLA